MEKYRYFHMWPELDLSKDEDVKSIETICSALGSEPRLRILRVMNTPPYIYTVPQLVKLTGIPTSTLLHHLERLEAACLCTVTYKSSAGGTTRSVGRDLHGVNLRLYYNESRKKESNYSVQVQEIGVGQFSEFQGSSLHFATAERHYYGMGDDFYNPARFDAQLIYTPRGIVTYVLSNEAARFHEVTELTLTLEICSEAPYFNNDYLSDITFWINGKEVVTYTSTGDFGDRAGQLNPAWWSRQNTQYGRLVTVTVTEEGVSLNGIPASSSPSLSRLRLGEGNKLELKFGNSDVASNCGGFNLFGKRFGDYPQDIVLTLKYRDEHSG